MVTMETSQPAAPVEAPRWTCAVCGELSATADARFCGRCGEPARSVDEPKAPPGVPESTSGVAEGRRRPGMLKAALAIAAVLALLAGTQVLSTWRAERSAAGNASMVGAGPRHTAHFPGPAPVLDDVAWHVLVGPAGDATAWRLERGDHRSGHEMYWTAWPQQLVDEVGIYLAQDRGLTAVDGETGTARWRYELEDARDSSSIALAGPGAPARPTRLVIAGGETVVGLDTATGEVRWMRKDMGRPHESYVVSAGSRVVVVEGYEHPRIVMLEAETGAEVWSQDLADTRGQSAFRYGRWVAGADDDTVLVVGHLKDGAGLQALDARDGSELWVLQTGTDWPQIHAIRHGRIYTSRWQTEREVVKTTTDGSGTTTESFVDAGTARHHVVVLDASIGGELWETQFDVDYHQSTGVTVDGERVYLAGLTGLRAHDAATGELVWERSDGSWGLAGNIPTGSRLHAWRLPEGNERLDWRRVGSALRTGHVFEIHGLDPETGSTTWRRDFPTREQWPGDLVASGFDRTYVRHADGRGILDSATGEIIAWHMIRAPKGCAPVIAGASVIVPGIDGLLSVDRSAPDPPRILRRLGYHESTTAAAVDGGLVAALVHDAVPTISETRLYTDWGMLEPAAVLVGRPSGPPVISDGAVYLTGAFQRDNVVKIHPRSGSTWWRRRVAGTVLGAPTVADRKVHLTTDRGLVTLDATSGDEIWTVDVDGLNPRPPVRAGGAVLVSTDSRVLAYDARTGERRWEADVDGLDGQAIAAAHGRTYATSSEGVVALSTATGERRWATPLDAPPTTAPVVSRGRVIIATGSQVIALDGATGRIRSTLDAGAHLVGEPAVADGIVYACSMEGRLVAVR
jgi:outer membrane protein assembly factor BamB